MTAILFLLSCGAVDSSGHDSPSTLSDADVTCRASCDLLYVAPCAVDDTFTNLPTKSMCYDACDRVDGGRDEGIWAACIVGGGVNWDRAEDGDCTGRMQECGYLACSKISVSALYDDARAIPDGC